MDADEWRRLCAAPCDAIIGVDGLEVRVTAEGMTPSNVFVVDPGQGTARVKVSGGSATAREIGIFGLAGGLAVAFGGMTLFGVGSIEDKSDVRTLGIAGLAVGAVATLVALPLLFSGSTTVRDGKGRFIASRGTATF